MSSRLLKQLLATVVIAAASVGAAGAVSAAPVIHAVNVHSTDSAVQHVYWVHRHGHRYWVRPRHR